MAASTATGEYQLDRSPSPEVDTAVPAERLRELGEQLLRVPEGFTVHPKLVKQLDRRREALAEDAPPHIDWAHAEALAFASLLTEGTPLRLTGQDTERGTFSQRHMVLHDAKTGQTVCPIQSLPDALAPLELHNSPLSELACMGFEYGYSQEAPGDARAVGGAVRRLRQLRAGDRRPVHRLGPGQVGADLAPHAAAAARLRGLGSRALLGAPGALPRARGARATSASPARRRRRSTSTCCAARRGSPSSARSW